MNRLLLLVVLVLAGCRGETVPPPLALTEAQARPLTDRTFEATPARIERGQYLVEGVLRCFVCHSPRDEDPPGAPPIVGLEGAGAVYAEAGERRLVASNLTPDDATGIGTWTDDMLARAIREGVGHDGRVLGHAMPYASFSVLSDEDLAAVVVYLRARAPVRNPLPPTRLPRDEQERLAAGLRPIMAPVPARDLTDPIERGRYTILLADCEGCHTAWEAPRNPGSLGGGNVIDAGGPWPAVFSTNLTPHLSGVSYDADAFVGAMRTGLGGTLSPRMPWVAFRHMSDEDLEAVHAFLQTRAPVAHYIKNVGAPTYCPVCEQAHGLGDANTLAPPVGVPIAPPLLDDYVGAYYSEAWDFTIRVTRTGDSLRAQEDDGPVAALIPQSDTRFLMYGGLAPLRFERDTSGAVHQLVSEEIEDVVLRRIE